MLWSRHTDGLPAVFCLLHGFQFVHIRITQLQCLPLMPLGIFVMHIGSHQIHLQVALSEWLSALTPGERPRIECLVNFLELGSAYQIIDAINAQAISEAMLHHFEPPIDV